jgi:hypothetical protein
MSRRLRPPGIPYPGATIPSILATLHALKEAVEAHGATLDSITDAGLALLDDSTPSEQRTTLGIEETSSGVTDHGALTGLSDDDHSQYHNDARGDARYSLLGHGHAASDITSGTIATARLGSGVADSTTFLRGDQTYATPPGSTSAIYGGSEIDFGTHPGTSVASLVVTGQTGITSSMRVIATKAARATADHSVDEHIVEGIDVLAGDIVDGVGFTLYAITRTKRLKGLWAIDWSYA